MNRKYLDIAAIIILIAFFEIQFIQLMGTEYPLYGLLKLAITINLIVPLMSFFVRLIDRVNSIAKKRSIIVTLESNRLYSYSAKDDQVIEVNSNFSTKEHLIANSDGLEKAFSNILRLLLEHKGAFTLAPLVVVKLDKSALNNIEQLELIKIVIRAGALDCRLTEHDASEEDIQTKVANISLDNFA